MLGKLSVLLVLCQIVVFTYGGVLRTTETEAKRCSERNGNCTTNEDCCDSMRCLPLGNGNYKCMYGTDNPEIREPNDAVHPPNDLINKLGCSLYAQSCKVLGCCSPYVCTAEGKCKHRPYGPYRMGGYGGHPGFSGKHKNSTSTLHA